MKYLKQFGIILTISFVGEILHACVDLPVPASIYGIVILFLLLESKLLPLSAVKDASNFLIQIMPVMFVPAAVGLLKVWDTIKSAWPVYLLVTVISTGVVMACAGLVTQLVVRIQNKKHSGEDSDNGELSYRMEKKPINKAKS